MDAYPYYEITGNGDGGGVSVALVEPVGDGVTWTQANTDTILAAIHDIVSAIDGVEFVTMYRYSIAHTQVTLDPQEARAAGGGS